MTNQFLGVFIFLLISRGLDKSSFGELSWALAVLTFVTTILSLRLEQIIVRNVAAGEDPSRMLTVFAAHNLLMGILFFIVLSLTWFLVPAFHNKLSLLWMLSISQLLSFFALPFRQIVTGRSSFTWLALLSTLSNFLRAAGFMACFFFSVLTLRTVLILFTVSSLAELLLGVWIVCRRLAIPFRLHDLLPAYKALIKSSLPQMGVVFLNAGIGRMDWILLGILSTPVRTAEYAFTYRAYEFSPLPLLVLAPFLMNRFAQSEGRSVSAERMDWLVRLEMVLATLPTLLLVLSWSPLVDGLTGNKYGSVNIFTFLILSFCIPFQYLINLYWTHEFSRNRLSLIFRITAVTAIVVLVGDSFLIPLWAGEGAALVLLFATILQYLLYARVSSFGGQREWARHLLVAVSIAVCSGLSAIWLTDSLILRLLLATGFYLLPAWMTGLIKSKDKVGLLYKTF